MPRQARIDAPGALQHIIVRDIEGRKIFRDNKDKDNFVERLGNIIKETSKSCYAWSLLSNHFHYQIRYKQVSAQRREESKRAES
jgi:putative transposase